VVALDKDTGRVTLGGLLGDDRIADVIPAVLRVIARDVRTEAAIREAVGGDRVITGKAIRRAYKDKQLFREGSGTKGDPFRYYRPEEVREGEEKESKREKRASEKRKQARRESKREKKASENPQRTIPAFLACVLPRLRTPSR